MSDMNFTFSSCFPIALEFQELRLHGGKLLMLLLYLLLILITMLGNGLVMLAIVTTRRLQTVTNYFVMNLAIVNLGMGAFVMPLSVLQKICGWRLGELLCNVWVSVGYLLCTAAIFTLCAISLHRYLAVTQPISYWKKEAGAKRWALWLLLVVWLIAFTLTAPPYFTWFELMDNGKGKLLCHYRSCWEYVTFSAVMLFIIPVMFMSYVYGRIACILRSQQKRKQSIMKQPDRRAFTLELTRKLHERSTQLPARLFHTLPNKSNTSKISHGGREQRAYNVLLLVMGAFIVCWLPFFIYHLLLVLLPVGYIERDISSYLIWVGLINSAINPFIYGFYYSAFRKAFKRLVLKVCCCGEKVSL